VLGKPDRSTAVSFVQLACKTRAACWHLMLGVLAALACSVPVHAQVTSLTMFSDPGDYIGGGQFHFYTPADGNFSAQGNYAGGVSLSFNTPSYEHWWHLDFAAPNNQPLAVGTYTGAARFPFQDPGQPGLSVYGDGRGCNTLTGSFQVLEVTYNALNEIASFDAMFEQHCEGAAPALRGQIRYQANPVVSLTAPTRLNAIQGQALSFPVLATDAQSRRVILTATGLPSGASFVDNGDSTGTFNWTPTASQAGTYLLKFTGDNQQGDTGATYSQIMVTAPPPPNDDFDNATVVPSIPFTVTYDAADATAAADDPFSCYGRNQSLWFAFTPYSDMRLEANTFGSNYDTTLSVYTGARGALNEIGCNDDAGGTLSSRVRFDAVAGTTYYIMASSLYPTPSANLVFNLLEAPAAFTIAPTVSQFGSVKPSTGEVTLTGSVMCTAPAYVTISGQLKQVRADVPISGYFSTFVACNGNTPWSATVQTQPALSHGRASALFTGGKATVTGQAQAFDPETGENRQVNLTVDITLRGGK